MKRILSNNNTCINISTESYNGKEQSPKGLGFSAVAYDIGYEKMGQDGELWSVQIKNNKKVWFRKNGMPIVTHEEPLITYNNTNDIEINPIIINESISLSNSKNQEEIPKEIKKTDYTIFYSYYTNKIKSEYLKNGIKKENKIIKEETIAEWNKLKKNKKELEILMNSIKNKT